MWEYISYAMSLAAHVGQGTTLAVILMVPVIALGVVMWKDPMFLVSFQNAKQKLKEMKIGW